MEKSHIVIFTDVSKNADHTQVSDVPQRVQCCVLFIKHYEHRWSHNASRHSTAVDVMPGGDEEEVFKKVDADR